MERIHLVVVDDDPSLAITVEGLTAGQQPRPELVAVADVEELYEYVRTGSIVIAGPSQRSAQAIADLALFRDAHPSIRLVLAYDKRPGAAMAEVIRTGAQALIDPSDEEALVAEIERAMAMVEQDRPAPVQTLDDEAAPLGRVFTVTSATGGCGKTFYASNMAFMLSKFTRGKVAIVDLDLQFGEVVTAMRVRYKHTIADAIEITSDEELGNYIPELMVAHESGVWILPAPSDPAQADTIRPQDVVRVIKALQQHYDYVVVDNPTGLGDVTLAAMDLSEHLFVMAALDLSSVRNLRLFLQTLDRLQIPNDALSLVLNKDQPGVGIEAGQVEKLFPAGFRSVIPFSKDVPRSMNQGIPVLSAASDHDLVAAVADGLVGFLPEDARADAEAEYGAPKKKGLFARFRKRAKATDDFAPVAPATGPVTTTSEVHA